MKRWTIGQLACRHCGRAGGYHLVGCPDINLATHVVPATHPVEQPTCIGSNIEPTHAEVKGKMHAVLVTHTCVLPKDHIETICQCVCEYTWVKNFK